MPKLPKEELERRYAESMKSIEIEKRKKEAASYAAGAAMFALAPSHKIGYYSYNLCIMLFCIIPNLLFMHLILEWF
jgi:hypothetical protein